MSLKSVSRMAVLVFATTVTSPAGSQQPPVAPTPAPSANQPRPNAAAPQIPGDPNVPPAVAAAGFAAAHTGANPSAGLR